MFRPLAVTLLTVATVAAAPVPQKPAKDYQKLADETEWRFEKLGDFNDRLSAELTGYGVKVSKGGGVTVTISNDKGDTLLGWKTHVFAPFVHRNGVFYYAEFSLAANGCVVVAFDLTAKKELWKAPLKGIGIVSHSIYSNAVRLEVLDDDTLLVFGKESLGRYAEIVDRGSGKTVGHKVFDEKK